MDIPAYKILMGCDGKNLAETAELYSLTEVEQDQKLLLIIPSKQRIISVTSWEG